MNPKGKSALDRSRIYLCAPVNALVEGIYKENIPLAEIKKHGDFGLGTFNGLDGEMVMLDGHVYQITSGGRVAVIDDDARICDKAVICSNVFREKLAWASR